MSVAAVVITVVGVGISGLLFWLSQRANQVAVKVAETPTSKVKDLGPGIVELKGKFRALEAPLTSPVSKVPCVYYAFRVVERYRKGNETRTRTVANERRFVRTAVEDGTGRAELDLGRATVEAEEKSGPLDDSVGQAVSAAGLGLGALLGVRTTIGYDRHYSETVLPEGSNAYVLGHAQVGANKSWKITAGEIPLLVSNLGEARVLDVLKSRSALLKWAALAPLIIAGILAVIVG